MLNNTDANVTDDANRSQNESNESSDRNISVTEQAVVAPTASVALDGIAPSEVWSQLLENDNAGLLDPLQEAVRSILAGTHHSKRERTLKETGVEAEHGALACVLKALCSAHNTHDIKRLSRHSTPSAVPNRHRSAGNSILTAPSTSAPSWRPSTTALSSK
jgi:hypothetical protein